MSDNQDNENNSLLFLNDLSEEQKESVIYCDSPQLILSGAGSGKTRVLTYKIIYLIKIKKIRPYNILALTFTKKAANEMKSRISKLIGENYAKDIKMGTFHSIFYRILKRNISYLEDKKYNSNFNIIDESEVKKLIKDILFNQFSDIVNKIIEKKGINDKVKSYFEIKCLINRIIKKIMNLKIKGITYDIYQNMENEIEKDKKRDLEYFKNIYEIYVKECKKKNVMDFEDLILNTLLLFKKNKNILEKYQNKFKYILIDEFQDTNHTQFEIIKYLSLKSQKICCVGDDCQSIYSFRGADINNIDNFSKTFPNYKLFKLCQNYRSTSNIIQVADLLIKHNKKQIEKNLFSKIKEIDGKVNILINETGINECENISEIIKTLIKDKKCDYKDIAILYRMNIQSYLFKDTFFKRDIPHKINNRISFYETKVIQNIIEYLKFILNPNLDLSLRKIINYPSRNIDEHNQNKLFSMAKSNNVSVWEIIKDCDNREYAKKYHIDKHLKKKLLSFREIILKIISIVNNKRVYGIVYELIESLELKHYLRNDHSSLEKINMLLEKIEEMEEDCIQLGLEKYTLKEFLEQISELVGNEEDYNENKVKLMTIHQAKGLEFKYVFVVGLEEGFYPIFCDLYEDEIEEERRVLYVAITRAKIKCYLSYANNRIIEEHNSKRTVSRFINEINNKELVQIYQFPDSLQKNNNSEIENSNEKNNNNNDKLITNNKNDKIMNIFEKEINEIEKKNNNIIKGDNKDNTKNEGIDYINNNIISLNEKEDNDNNDINKEKKIKNKKKLNLNENLKNNQTNIYKIEENNNHEIKMLVKKRING